MSPQITTRMLADATEEIQDGDLLLFRGKGFIARVIQFFTNSIYSHAGMVTWVNGRPFCAEIREGVGGRLVTLESQVRRCPNCIDVYRFNPDGLMQDENVKRSQAARYMERLAGCHYGYWAVARAALAHLPLVRLLLARTKAGKALRELDTKAAATRKSPPFCSMGVDLSWWQGASVDIVPELESELTEPVHLSRSYLFRYQFTLA